VASHDRRDAVRPPALGDLVDAALVDLPLGRDLGAPDCLLRKSRELPPRCTAENNGVDCACRRDEFGWGPRHPAEHSSMGRLRCVSFVIMHAGRDPSSNVDRHAVADAELLLSSYSKTAGWHQCWCSTAADLPGLSTPSQPYQPSAASIDRSPTQRAMNLFRGFRLPAKCGSLPHSSTPRPRTGYVSCDRGS